MFTSVLKRTIAALALALAVGSSLANDQRAPETPTRVTVEEGNKVHFHAYAVGVQIYVCRETAPGSGQYAWVFKAPEAVLFDNDGNVVGLHYGGPTWESSSGSFVVAARVDGVTVDPTAIPWLLLRAVVKDGPGIFARTTFIQRVNTAGGLAPAPSTATSGNLGEEVRIPYTADYFFYRAE